MIDAAGVSLLFLPAFLFDHSLKVGVLSAEVLKRLDFDAQRIVAQRAVCRFFCAVSDDFRSQRARILTPCRRLPRSNATPRTKARRGNSRKRRSPLRGFDSASALPMSVSGNSSPLSSTLSRKIASAQTMRQLQSGEFARDELRGLQAIC